MCKRSLKTNRGVGIVASNFSLLPTSVLQFHFNRIRPRGNPDPNTGSYFGSPQDNPFLQLLRSQWIWANLSGKDETQTWLDNRLATIHRIRRRFIVGISTPISWVSLPAGWSLMNRPQNRFSDWCWQQILIRRYPRYRGRDTEYIVSESDTRYSFRGEISFLNHPWTHSGQITFIWIILRSRLFKNVIIHVVHLLGVWRKWRIWIIPIGVGSYCAGDRKSLYGQHSNYLHEISSK